MLAVLVTVSITVLVVGGSAGTIGVVAVATDATVAEGVSVLVELEASVRGVSVALVLVEGAVVVVVTTGAEGSPEIVAGSVSGVFGAGWSIDGVSDVSAGSVGGVLMASEVVLSLEGVVSAILGEERVEAGTVAGAVAGVLAGDVVLTPSGSGGSDD